MGLPLALMTELEAVNAMLETVGETPISSLPESGVTEAYIARSILHRVSREIQGKGLSFNTDRRYRLARDVDGFVEIPANVLSVDKFYPSDGFVIRHNTAKNKLGLYDVYNQTFTLGADPMVDIVWFYAWEHLPAHCRDLIYIIAGRRFQARFQSSQIIHELTAEEEIRAWAQFWDIEYRAEDTSLAYAPGSWHITHRRV